MPPVNRHEPIRTDCSASQLSLMEFMREYPDDNACLEHLWRQRYAPDGEHARVIRVGSVERQAHNRRLRPWDEVALTIRRAETYSTVGRKIKIRLGP